MEFKDIEFQIGDIISFKSDNLFAKIIKRVTHGPVTHTAIVQDSKYGVTFVSEMGPTGIENNSLTKFNHKSGKIYAIHRIGYLDKMDLIEIRRELIKEHLKHVKYDYRGLLEFVFPWINDRKNRFYCSEFVFKIIKEYLTTYPVKFNEKISPNELFNFFENDKYKTINNIIRIYRND